MQQDLNLSIRVGKVVLRNPIILSPGPCSRTPTSMKRFADAGCAAVISKTLTPLPLKGNPNPKRVNLPNDLVLNAEGGPNIGMEAFGEEMKKVKGQIKDSHFIISIVGKTIEEFVALAVQSEKLGAEVLDLDITCPNMSDKGSVDSWQKDIGLLYELITAVKRAISIPLWIKFINAYGTLLQIAETLEKAGADAVVPLVSIGAMAIDLETSKPILGFKHGTGILTGSPLKYAGLKAVADVVRTVSCPVIATGGCFSGLDVIEYLMVGARAVEMHTVFMKEGIAHVEKMISEMTQFMKAKGVSRIEEFIGLTLRHLPEKPFSVWYQTPQKTE